MGLTRPVRDTGRPGERRRRQRGTATLLEMLHDPRAEVRRRSALDLAGERDVIPELLRAYAAEGDPAVRDALQLVLVEHDDVVVARAFAAELGDGDAAVRNAAASGLEVMPNATASIIDELLDDPDAQTRTLVVAMLGRLRHPVALPRLVDVVAHDTDENVVAVAVDAAITQGADCRALLRTALERFRDNPYLMFLSQTLRCRS
jgi:HEAT repeat protein